MGRGVRVHAPHLPPRGCEPVPLRRWRRGGRLRRDAVRRVRRPAAGRQARPRGDAPAHILRPRRHGHAAQGCTEEHGAHHTQRARRNMRGHRAGGGGHPDTDRGGMGVRAELQRHSAEPRADAGAGGGQHAQPGPAGDAVADGGGGDQGRAVQVRRSGRRVRRDEPQSGVPEAHVPPQRVQAGGDEEASRGGAGWREEQAQHRGRPGGGKPRQQPGDEGGGGAPAAAAAAAGGAS
mmetsp:Transcript_2830/g.9982  ORF Transcript_2830/g.9982 Transcript_2830/m.9982 type:complete len:235 (-) Transcript_2830:124-828(-)